MRNGRSKLAVLAAIPLLAAACSNGDTGGDNGSANTTDAELSASLTGAGASFPDPLFQDWMHTYGQDVQPGVSINYQSVGSGAGIEQFLEQTVDFGSSERYLTDEDLQVAADAPYETLQDLLGCCLHRLKKVCRKEVFINRGIAKESPTSQRPD
jgi:phosphate transport system substrate-binding protein